MSQPALNTSRQDFFIGAFALVVGIAFYFWLIPNWVEQPSFGQTSPRLFPDITAVAIVLIGISMMIKNRHGLNQEGTSGFGKVGLEVAFWLVIGALTLLGTLHVGFAIANAVVCFACMVFAGQRRHLVLMAIFCVVFPLLLKLFAVHVFDVVLP